MGGGQDAQATVSSPPGGEDNQGGGEDIPGNFNPLGFKLPAGILTPGGQAAQGSR